MRQIVLDTETTGLDPLSGHKLIEIGCIELVDRRFTRNTFHQYVNPERAIDQGAINVHGITNEFVQDKPLFHEIMADFLAFINGAELIIHNASFDIGFINHELKLADSKIRRLEKICTITDTLKLARKLHPGQRNNLDALCKRYKVDNSNRELHGALLDARLLAGVYLAMTGGQSQLFNEKASNAKQQLEAKLPQQKVTRALKLPVQLATAEETQAHAEFLGLIKKQSGSKAYWEALEVETAE